MEIGKKRRTNNPEMETCWKLTPSRKIFIFKTLLGKGGLKNSDIIKLTIGMLAARE